MSTLRVAIVDDSTFVRVGLTRLLKEDKRVSVVGAAATGEELLANLDQWRPDVVTLDLNMPGMGGMATLERIMHSRPIPVIIMSTHTGKGASLTLEALNRGAVDFIDKEAYSLVDFQTLREVLLQKLLAVVSRPARAGADLAPASWESSYEAEADKTWRRGAFDLVVIGASTGGPHAIEQILGDLGPDLPVPIAIVQHMPPGFTAAFAERLDGGSPFTVIEAVDGAPVRPGTVYIGAAGWHMKLEADHGAPRIVLDDARSGRQHRPSVDVLFESAAEVVPKGTVAVLLTGMGQDGARGMLRLAQAGAYTIAQDQKTSVVYGMPRVAVELHAVKESLPLEQIGPKLRKLVVDGSDGTK